MKDVRIKLGDQEYERIRSEAEKLQITVRQLLHNRATGRGGTQAALYSVQVLSEEMAQIRDGLNQIIRRETSADIRLYEDDLIRLEGIMSELEQTVTRYISGVLKEVHTCGNLAV